MTAALFLLGFTLGFIAGRAATLYQTHRDMERDAAFRRHLASITRER